MASKETKKRIREERLADQARYDEVTRRLEERIERGTAKRDDQQEPRRESSRRTSMASKETRKKIREEVLADQARYDEVTRRLEERIERGTAKRQAQDEPRRKSS
jgi:hypothetical protein